MASNYGIADKDVVGKKEYFDDGDLLSKKLDLLASWVSESKHCIIFTGAGISTSTGIPDFRSGMNTVLTTGPGVWELRDKGAERPSNARTTSALQAMPSIAHMAIVQLQHEGIVKFVVSQNTDGLHLRSGLQADALAELHGNTNLEKCQKCRAKYLRDFRTRNARKVHEHVTGRRCDDPKCRGALVDSIINFGEGLPSHELNRSYEEADKADLCIVLGSSLRVSPANDIPEVVALKDKKLVIGNLQKTPLHSLASMSIHAMCDEIMQGLMQRLGMPIPRWELQRRMNLVVCLEDKTSSTNGLTVKMCVTGLLTDKDIPYSFLKQVMFTVTCHGVRSNVTLNREPFSARISLNCPPLKPESIIKAHTELHFHGHYGEKSFELSENLSTHSRKLEKEYLLLFDPIERKWRIA